MADIRSFPKKVKPQNITHVARVDLIPLAALYYLHVDRDLSKAQSLLSAFATQAAQTAAIELTQEQYDIFKAATPHIVKTIEATYNAYLNEADKRI